MRYDLVNNSRRQKLVQMVYGENPITTRQACLKLGINLSTAKYILKIFRRQGRVQRQTRRHKPLPPKPEPVLPMKEQKEDPCLGQLPNSLNQSQILSGLEEIKNFNDPPSKEEEKKAKDQGALQIGQDYESVKQMTINQLQSLLGDLNNKYSGQKKELSIIDECYKLIRKLLVSLETREAQIRKQKQKIESEILPTVLNEIRLRQTQTALAAAPSLTKEMLASLVIRASQVESLYQGVNNMMTRQVDGPSQPSSGHLSERTDGNRLPSTH